MSLIFTHLHHHWKQCNNFPSDVIRAETQTNIHPALCTSNLRHLNGLNCYRWHETNTFLCFLSFSWRSIRSSRSLSSSSRSSSVSGLMLFRLTRTSRISRTRTTFGMSRARASQPYWSIMRSNSWPTTAAMSYTSITVRSATFFSSDEPKSSMTDTRVRPVAYKLSQSLYECPYRSTETRKTCYRHSFEAKSHFGGVLRSNWTEIRVVPLRFGFLCPYLFLWSAWCTAHVRNGDRCITWVFVGNNFKTFKTHIYYRVNWFLVKWNMGYLTLFLIHIGWRFY